MPPSFAHIFSHLCSTQARQYGHAGVGGVAHAWGWQGFARASRVDRVVAVDAVEVEGRWPMNMMIKGRCGACDTSARCAC